MAKSKSKFLERVNECVDKYVKCVDECVNGVTKSVKEVIKWVEGTGATERRCFVAVLLFAMIIGLSSPLRNVLFNFLKYLFIDNNDKYAFSLFILFCVIVVIITGQWVWGKQKIFTKKSNRLLVLLFCACLGLFLGIEIVRQDILNCIFSDSMSDCLSDSKGNCPSDSKGNCPSDSIGDKYDRVRNSLVGVLIGLPVFIALWVFRTMDTREGINKTQEQINFNFLSDAKKSFLGKGPLKERTASFIQLVKLQQQKLFQEEIKIIFKGGKLNRPTDEKGRYLKGEEGAYLKGVDLSNIDLSDTEFELQGANLEGANLQGASLQGASLQGANLKGASLQGANLKRAQLQIQPLKETLRRGEKLQETNLEEANLKGADLERANLQGAKLQGTKFDNRTNLTDADLRGAAISRNRDNNALTRAKVILTDVQKNQLNYVP